MAGGEQGLGLPPRPAATPQAERAPAPGPAPTPQLRTGRMSLREFQQRAMSYDEAEPKDDAAPALADIFVEIAPSPRTPSVHRASPRGRSHCVSQDASEGTVEGMRHRLASRRSTGSLFGNLNHTTKSKSRFYGHQLKVLSFLILLGVIGGPLHFGLRVLYGYIKSLRTLLIDQTSTPWLEFMAWAAHTVVFSQIALLWTRYSPVAAGSGVSQMKSVLTGIDPRMYLPGYFDFATLIAKMGGLVLAMGSGLVVGTEGAYVHIMSIVTHHLLRARFFAGFSTRLNSRLQLLAAACAVGVSSTFSSPIGGVLFSMEVTSTYYLVSNYMKAFISSVSGSLMLQMTLTLSGSSARERGSSILNPKLPLEPFAMQEIPLFILLGSLVGVLATGMISLLRVVALQRKSLRGSNRTWKRLLVVWADPLAIALLTATLTYWPGDFMHTNSMDDLAILFTGSELPASWQSISKFFSLSVLCAVYMLLLPLSITLALPTGVWLPSFIAGAAFGRLFGEALHALGLMHGIVPGVYSLAGAAAFAGASTGTVSAAVITLEITGSMELMLPIFCAVLASMGVAHVGPEKSVYDTLLVTSGLPYLPLLDLDPHLTAGDLVEPLLVYVTKRTSVARLVLAVTRMPGQDLPVVRSDHDMSLLGLVNANEVKQLIRLYYENNQLPDVDVDLGEAVAPACASTSSWTTFMAKFGKTGGGGRGGGFYGQASYDQVYHQLSTTIKQSTVYPGPTAAENGGGGLGQVPFMMDDDRMMGLLAESWSERKAQLLHAPVKLNYGHFCVLKPMALTVASITPLDDLHMIFTMMRCDHCYVCEQGSLVGVVTTKALLSAGEAAAKGVL